MRIHLEKIMVPVKVDRDTITGVLMVGAGIGGVNIKATRSLSGWTPYLTISVNTHCVHHTDATKEEMKSFDTLMNRAVESQFTKEQKERIAVLATIYPILFHP